MERKLIILLLWVSIISCTHSFQRVVGNEYEFSDQPKRNIALRLSEDGSFTLMNRTKGALLFSIIGTWSNIGNNLIQLQVDSECSIEDQKKAPKPNVPIDFDKAMDDRNYIFPCINGDTVVIDRKKQLVYLSGYQFKRK